MNSMCALSERISWVDHALISTMVSSLILNKNALRTGDLFLPAMLLVKRTGVNDGSGVFLPAKDDEQIGYHSCFSFVIQFNYTAC